MTQLLKDVHNIVTKLELKKDDGIPASNAILQMLSGSLKDQLTIALERKIHEQWALDKDAAEKAVRVGSSTPEEFAAAKKKAREETDKPIPTYTIVGQTLRTTVTDFMPSKVKEKVKRWVRNYCKKPNDMKIRKWAMLVQNLNNSDIRWLPPYNRTADGNCGEFPDDELKEIILNGVPKRWHGEIERQGFDMWNASLHEVIDFFEQIESAEALASKMEQPIPKKKGDPKKKQRTASDSDKNTSQEDLVCPIHGKGHSEQQCRTIKKMKKEGTWKGAEAFKKNKTWSRSTAEAKENTKKELAAYIQKTITKSLRKELNALSKKRKSKKQDSDDESLNAVEELIGSDSETALNLTEFNYSEFENLKISSDDEDEDSDTVSV